MVSKLFSRFAESVARAAGKPLTFVLSMAMIIVWAVCGPLFGFSDTWQLVINTSTTIVTFLMLFLIQRSQNRDTKALHVKLNELIAAVAGASNRLIDVEDLTEEELTRLHEQYRQLAAKALTNEDDRAQTTLSDVAPPVDKTLAGLRPDSDDETPPGPSAEKARRRGGVRPSS